MNSLIYLFLFHTLGSKLQVNGQNETGQMQVSVWGWVGGKEEGGAKPRAWPPQREVTSFAVIPTFSGAQGVATN